MTNFDTGSFNGGEEQNNSSPPIHYRPSTTGCSDRLVELEIENARLNRLVAELLIKNQQLRKPD